MRWIHLFRLTQGETESLRHVLFLEEVHNLFPEQSWLRNSNNALENVYREIRAFGQGIVSITQHPSLLPIYLLGNCHTQVYLGLQHASDIVAATKALFLDESQKSFLNAIKPGECILKIKNRIEPCLVKIPLLPVNKGAISDAWLAINTPRYFPMLSDGKTPQRPSYLPRDNIYSIFQEEPIPSKMPIDIALLEDIFLHPFSPVTQRYARLKINPKFGNRFKNLLIAQGAIQPQRIVTKTGRLTLFDITKKGLLMLRELGHDAKEYKEGVVHKFWKFKIADEYRAKGYTVEIEKDINGRPDIIAEKDGKRIAIEIETGKSNAEKNRQRDLATGFDKVISIQV